jgi:hypothetical protein
MNFHTYILKYLKDSGYYYGYTADLIAPLAQVFRRSGSLVLNNFIGLCPK